MKCKDNQCNNEVAGKQVFCSGACRTRTSRTSVTDASVTKPCVTSEAQRPTPDAIQAAAAVGRDCTPMQPSHPPCTDSQLTSPCLRLQAARGMQLPEEPDDSLAR